MELCPGIDLPRSEPEAELLPPETKTQLKENNPSRMQLLRVQFKELAGNNGQPGSYRFVLLISNDKRASRQCLIS
jgi:hypothetical protein